jgi:glucose-6-phosphate 1-dehydrogenase
LAASRQLVTLGFHEPPLRMFPVLAAGTRNGRRNEIVIDFADPGSITLGFLAKEPGAAMKLGAAELSFHYDDSFSAANALEGYERLLLDAIRCCFCPYSPVGNRSTCRAGGIGNQSLQMRAEWV